jgi:hypothetical protein
MGVQVKKTLPVHQKEALMAEELMKLMLRQLAGSDRTARNKENFYSYGAVGN